MDDTTKRKLLSALCHGSIFFSATIVSIAIPVAILYVSDDPVIQANAKEALNFHFNMWIYDIYWRYPHLGLGPLKFFACFEFIFVELRARALGASELL